MHLAREPAMTLVLVHLGCHNRIPKTGKLKINSHSFLTVSEAGKSKIKVSADSKSGEDLVLGSQVGCLFISRGGRSEGTLWGLCNKGTNPIHEASALMT